MDDLLDFSFNVHRLLVKDLDPSQSISWLALEGEGDVRGGVGMDWLKLVLMCYR